MAELLQCVNENYTVDDTLDLPVNFKGEELAFPARLEQSGYTHRIVVNVYGTEIYFEPDEERAYRALVEKEAVNKKVTVELLQAISAAIEHILH